ncbi:ABC transporter permease [Duganella sp. Root336D2]|uniref:ABC transporter permease n=1 Tax=Duganella sp. Root336D2 TaxID=1736518 RepID=UPI0006F4D6E5|nr:ABC transporter permease [Duganella sp. Root336D2]KQV44863.1 sugar ABC transporter permease [Duganella sp. Root336D2]
MNPHAPQSTQPLALLASLYKNRNLIFDLIKREVIGRYRGSTMGLLWSFFNPVLMLAVYTFMFSVVFKARWVGGSDSKVEFALIMFTGLLMFNLFGEVVNRSPSLILNNANYVKKVIFPLEVLPVVALGSAAFHMLISLLVWLIFFLIFFSVPSIAALQVFLIFIPLMLLTLGIAWLLASLGVYLRDVGQIISVITIVLMYMSPVFYPITAIPEDLRGLMLINPLTYIVEDTRNVMIWGKSLDWLHWGYWTAFSAVVAWLGFAWFQKTRKGFADVL